MIKKVLLVTKMDDQKVKIAKKIAANNHLIIIDEFSNYFFGKELGDDENIGFCPISDHPVMDSWFVSGYYSLDYLGDFNFDEIVWMGEGHPQIKEGIELIAKKNNRNVLYC